MKTLEIYEDSQKVKTAISIKASTAMPAGRLIFYIIPEWRQTALVTRERVRC